MQIGPHRLPGRTILAPMAGLVSTPFRGIARAHGAAATPTELISAKGLLHRNPRTADMITAAPGESPFWVQLFGADPETMARAAEVAVRLGAEILDLNMGCPVRKVTNSGAGAALSQAPERAVAIVKAIRTAVGEAIPVTAKIRSGWDKASINALDVGPALEQAGVAALCLHPRTRAQRYSGRADWSLISALRQRVQIPLIGNGDVACADDAARMRSETGCDAVMIGRGALGNPWIFTGIEQGIDVDPAPAARLAVVLDHWRQLAAQTGDRHRAVYRFRSRVLYYARGLDGGVNFRRSIVGIEDPDAFEDAIRSYFGSALRARGYKPGQLHISGASKPESH